MPRYSENQQQLEIIRAELTRIQPLYEADHSELLRVQQAFVELKVEHSACLYDSKQAKTNARAELEEEFNRDLATNRNIYYGLGWADGLTANKTHEDQWPPITYLDDSREDLTLEEIYELVRENHTPDNRMNPD